MTDLARPNVPVEVDDRSCAQQIGQRERPTPRRAEAQDFTAVERPGAQRVSRH